MVILQMLGVEKWIVDLDCWDFIGKYREIHGNPLSMEVFFGWDFSENCNSLDEL